MRKDFSLFIIAKAVVYTTFVVFGRYRESARIRHRLLNKDTFSEKSF